MRLKSSLRRVERPGITRLDYVIPIQLIREGNHFVAYSPALDLATHGTSLPDAVEAHKRAARLFFRELERMGTTEEVLTGLGWSKQEAAPARRGGRPIWKLVPPEVIGNITERISI